MIETIVYIHRDAPAKPNLGHACNGCGVCCAAEPCPVSRLFLAKQAQGCKALQWHTQDKRYYCGMVLQPAFYIKWLPNSLSAFASRRFKRWIAADWKCDSDAIL